MRKWVLGSRSLQTRLLACQTASVLSHSRHHRPNLCKRVECQPMRLNRRVYKEAESARDSMRSHSGFDDKSRQ